MMAGSGRVLRLPPMPTIKEVLKIYKVNALKKLSQNFLLNPRICWRIANVGGRLKGCHVCEIGPGPGSITRKILEAGAKNVVVIEKDYRFMPGLQMLNEASGGKVEIHHGDVLRFDMSNIFPREEAKDWSDGPPNIHIIGNLPFNVSTPLIIKFLQNISEHSGAWSYGRTRMTLTFQHEVAERMVAQISGDQRSRLSIMCQYLCDVKYNFTIKGKSFYPAPDVDVGVVHFTPKVEPLIKLPFKLVEKVIRHVFHYRQKMCKRGVQTLFPPDQPEFTRQMFSLSEVSPDSRPTQLSIEEFDRLCNVYSYLCNQNPGLVDYYYRSEENAALWRTNKVPLGI